MLPRREMLTRRERLMRREVLTRLGRADEAGGAAQAHGKVDEDGSRYLLGDHLGNLLLLVLQHDGSHVVGLKTEPLGCISAPSTISYLDNGVVYIGSSFGDSQLVRSACL